MKELTVWHSSNTLFNNFEQNYIKDFGFHLGTERCALTNLKRINGNKNDKTEGYMYECNIKLHNPYFFKKDLSIWDNVSLSNYFLINKEDRNVFKLQYEILELGLYNIYYFKYMLIKSGYDSAEYINTKEISFDENNKLNKSYIIFNTDNINIINIYKVKKVPKKHLTYEFNNIKKKRK